MCMYASKIITTTIYPTVATVVGLGFGWYNIIMVHGQLVSQSSSD